MRDYDERFDRLRESLAERVDAAVLSDALAYLSFREWGLALEALCDQLLEHAVVISQRECELIEELRSAMGIPKERLAFVRELVAR
ncbi:MafI family immunity protein [Sandaracinus amylolyticus]|uniref:MafI family immunity protein n=1 Tax=Sandaracinus amylolyticus TaxID=927083 RepID=UPI001F2C278D|nr:MafI family immunity protein [Sandaracinus amylolyticus]UJR81520.1 Hypothetical protein I5071_35800 [Sandaracinus amylolyticus]